MAIPILLKQKKLLRCCHQKIWTVLSGICERSWGLYSLLYRLLLYVYNKDVKKKVFFSIFEVSRRTLVVSRIEVHVRLFFMGKNIYRVPQRFVESHSTVHSTMKLHESLGYPVKSVFSNFDKKQLCKNLKYIDIYPTPVWNRMQEVARIFSTFLAQM